MTSKEYAKALEDEKGIDRCQASHVLGGLVKKNPSEIASGFACDFDPSP